MVCTGPTILYCLLIVCLHGVHKDNSTLSAAGCVQHGVHRDSSTVLAAECACDTGSVSCNGHKQSITPTKLSSTLHSHCKDCTILTVHEIFPTHSLQIRV